MPIRDPLRFHSTRALIAACSNGVAGVLIFSSLPLILGGFAEKYQLDDLRTGALGSIYFGLYALIALSSIVWIHRLPWRLLSITGILTMILGLTICRLLPSFQGAMLGLACVGVGAALIYPISFTLIACRPNKDRDYAIKLIPEQLIPGLLIVITASFFVEQLAILNLLSLLTGLLLIALFIARWIPERPEHTGDQTISFTDNKWVLLGLVALNIYFMGFAGLWAFFERIGNDSSLDPAVVSQLLALGLLSSAMGPLIAALLGDRLGRPASICLALAGTLLPLLAATGQISADQFTLIMALLPLAYYFGITYFFGVIADADHNGRYTALTPFSLAAGAALGPFLFGLIKGHYGLGGAYVFVSISLIAGGLLILWVDKNLTDSPTDFAFRSTK